MSAFMRTAAMARLESVRALRSRGALMAAVLFVSAHAVGRWQDVPDGFFVVGFLMALLFGFSPGLSEDRARAFDRLLVPNLLRPVDYALGKVAGMAVWVFALAAWAWAAAVALSAGDVAFASWYAALAFLLGTAALPWVVLTDLLLDVRLPAAVVFVAALVCMVVAIALGADPARILMRAGLLITPHSWPSLSPLLVRALVGVAVAPLLIVAADRVRRRA